MYWRAERLLFVRLALAFAASSSTCEDIRRGNVLKQIIACCRSDCGKMQKKAFWQAVMLKDCYRKIDSEHDHNMQACPSD